MSERPKTEGLFDPEATGDRSKRFLTWKGAVERFEELMDGFRDRVRAKIQQRVFLAIQRGDLVEAVEEVRCWLIFRRAWKNGVMLGKRRLKLLRWKQRRKPGYGRVWSRREKGKPCPRGRPTIQFMTEEAREREANKRQAKKANAPKRRRGRPRKPESELSRPRKSRRPRGRPKKYRRGVRLGNHRVTYGASGKLRYIY